MTLVEMEPAVADAYMVLVEAMDVSIHDGLDPRSFGSKVDITNRLDDAQDAFCNVLENSLTMTKDLTPSLTESVALVLAAELVELRARVDRMEAQQRQEYLRDQLPYPSTPVLSMAQLEELRREQEAANVAEIRRLQARAKEQQQEAVRNVAETLRHWSLRP